MNKDNKINYKFVALFNKEEEGYSVIFPDLPGCATQGDTLKEAYKNAKEALEGHLETMIEFGMEIPRPRRLEKIIEDDDEWYEFSAEKTIVQHMLLETKGGRDY